MQDLETKSLWSQISGICIWGEMEGTKLKTVPFSHTTFGAFKIKYPNGKLLKKPTDSTDKIDGSSYDSYFADKERLGIFGRVDNFKRLAGKDKVYGIRFENSEFAVSERYLTKNGYAMIVSESMRVYVTFDSASLTAAAFALPDSLKLAGKIEINNQTAKAFPVISAYWFAWVSFFPETELIK